MCGTVGSRVVAVALLTRRDNAHIHVRKHALAPADFQPNFTKVWIGQQQLHRPDKAPRLRSHRAISYARDCMLLRPPIIHSRTPDFVNLGLWVTADMQASGVACLCSACQS